MNTKKILAAVLALSLCLSLLAGCGAQKTTATDPDQTTAAGVESAAPETNAGSEETNTHTKRDPNEPFTITDMGGREVTFDHAIEKAYAANPMGILLIRTMDFSKLGGYASKLSDAEKQFIPEEYWDLPNLGAWSTATPTANIEELVKADIDVIIVIQVLSEKVTQLAENIQSQTGIPTVLVSCKLEDLAASYEFMGELFDDPERAKILGDYCAQELAEVAALAATIPESERHTVYYAEGAGALETDPSGSFHTEVFDFLGLINVADVAENTTNGFVGQSTVSLEQVIAWDPEYIIRNVSGTGTSDNVTVPEILNSPDWAGITAVKNGNVYAAPTLPNNWIDRPPSVNRIIGVKWLANLIYPDIFNYDIYDEAQEFFSLFYNIDLTDAQLDKIMANSK